MLSCQHCKKSFPKKQNLQVHQQTAKYCLKIQEEQKQSQSNEVKELLKVIQWKDNELKQKEKELRQKEKDLKQKDEDLKQKDEDLKQKDEDLREKDRILKDVINSASAPKTNITVNNNTKYHIGTFDKSAEEINYVIDTEYTEKDFMRGQKGVAFFTYDKIIRDEEGKPTYYCTDTARGKFVYKNKDGILQTDLKLEALLKLIGDGIIKKSHRIYEVRIPEMTLENCTPYVTNLADINNLKDHNATFVTTLAGLTCNMILNNNNGDTTYEITATDNDDDDAHDEELMKRFYEQQEQIRLSRAVSPQTN
jgi:hypothetical protein